jgi:chorismate lyase/3-hydroxybenzoate synthase
MESSPIHPAGRLDRLPVLPPLGIGYEHGDPAERLAEPNVLAVIGFGTERGLHADPRYLAVPLVPLSQPAPLEVWRSRGPIVCGREAALRYATDGDYSFVAVELDERELGGIAAASREAYAALTRFCRTSATPHLLRVWNHLDAINAGAGDAERYRQFCSGRAAGFGRATPGGYPAASAIGVPYGQGMLQVYALAARLPGTAVENPRQWSAWRYPRQYGPTAPSFVRAMRAPSLRPQLYISGTAAVVGHASHHPGDVVAQLTETLTNLDSLLVAAGSRAPLGRGRGDLGKVYLRDPRHAAAVRELLEQRLGRDLPLLLLHGEVCRAELLIEIDGIHGG